MTTRQLRSVQPFGRRRDVQRFEPHPVRHDWHCNPRHLLTVQAMESVPDDEADKRGKEKPSFIQRQCDRGETQTPIPAPVPAPIVVRPTPCPCTTRSPGATQEVLSGLLPVIRQQAMQLQSQIMRENTRVLTDVQDVTSDASVRTTSTLVTSTPKKNPQTDVTRLGGSSYHVPAYSGPTYSAPLSRSLPATTPTADKASQTKPKKTLSNILWVPVRRRGGPSLDEWDSRGDVHEVPFMENLREELRMQMWSIHTRYNCARKVLTRHAGAADQGSAAELLV